MTKKQLKNCLNIGGHFCLLLYELETQKLERSQKFLCSGIVSSSPCLTKKVQMKFDLGVICRYELHSLKFKGVLGKIAEQRDGCQVYTS